MLLELNEGSNLYKFKDCERWGTVFPEQEAHNADELSVETTIPQTQQETAYQRHRHTDKTSQKSVNKQLKRLNVRLYSHCSSLLESPVLYVLSLTWVGYKLAFVCLPRGPPEHHWLCWGRWGRMPLCGWTGPKTPPGFCRNDYTYPGYQILPLLVKWRKLFITLAMSTENWSPIILMHWLTKYFTNTNQNSREADKTLGIVSKLSHGP